MKARAFILSLTICLINPTPFYLRAQESQSVSNYTLRHFTPADGLGSTQTRGIIQDSLGYIWIASSTGLSRYDGYNFNTYKFDPGNHLRSAFRGGIEWLWLDRSGQVWIISDILSRYSSKTDNLVHYKPELNLAEVRRICFEKNGPVVWLGTRNDGLYSFNTETNKTTHYLRNHSDSLTRAKRNSVWGISDRGSSLLVATRQGLWTFDKTTGNFSRPECAPKDSTFLYNTSIWHILDWPRFDPDDTWLVLENGLLKMNKQLSIDQRFDYPDGFRTNNYRRDEQGIFWLMDLNNRPHRYNPFDGSFDLVEINPGGEPFIFERNFFVDRNQTLWSGSETNSVYQLIPQSLSFYNFSFPERGRWTVSSLYHANKTERLVLAKTGLGRSDNELWTAFPILNEKMDSVEFQKLKMDEPFQGVIMSTTVNKNTLWLCSWNMGITAMHINDKGVIEPDNRSVLTSDGTNPNTVSNENNGFIYADQQENIWIASRGNGISKIVSKEKYGEEGSVLRYRHVANDSSSLSHDFGLRIYPEDEESLWVLTWAGADLYRNGVFEHVLKNKETPRTILKASDGSLFIGTMGGLYQAYKSGDHYRIGDSIMFKSHAIEYVLEDRQGRIWFTNPLADKLVCYDRKQGVSIEFLEKDGLPTGVVDFSQTSKGAMVLASIHGFTLFDPLSFQIQRSSPHPILTSLLVNNQVPHVGPGGERNEFAIETHISELDELVLDYGHNNFAIEFSSMEMTSPNKNLYRHMLEGFDNDWIETDSKNRMAAYTNLDAGTYTFKVRASNHQGIWSDQETTLTIRILPPPWKTWWAYTFYGIIFLGIFLSLRRYDMNRVVLKHRAEHLGELDKLKTRFFSNISHEFRTPISLILGPLKELYNKVNNEDQKTSIGIMLRNGQRLLRLVNQLLDLSRLEAGKTKLHASQTDLVQFLREIAASYESLAADRKIRYFFYPEKGELLAYIDPDKIEKVVHNLLSNAFKFTSDGGEVILNLKASQDHAVIVVKDTGIGIPANELNKVFDRFYQVDSSQTRGYEGSGLGMALAKELVELHHGTISVESRPGEGSTFTVRLPLGKAHLRNEEILPAHPSGGDIGDYERTKLDSGELQAVENATHGENGKEKTTIPTDQPVLLIVEDNADMRNYIRRTLSDQYQIVEAENGRAGLALAKESVPDLIISDIMMPEMDGYALCDKIKTNELTSHIPVILLTAKADRESKLHGLETGADDYLAKPFDADELKLIVRNRIEERRKMRERFSREVTLEPRQIAITSLDEKFLMKVLAIIEEHMDDEHFSIDELSREAGYSNMHFYRKIKALADQTPSQFLRTIRLKRAAELLSKNSDNVTQIAYSVGFSSLSYFNKCFKEQFGVTPGQYGEGSLKSKTSV